MLNSKAEALDYSSLNLKIAAVRGFALSSPYSFGNNLGQPMGVKSVGFIEVESEDGTIGLGETYAGVYAPELIEPVAKFLAEFVIGLDISDDQIPERLEQIPFLGREGLVRSVASGLEIALWDLRGKLLDTPVFRLLGGTNSVEVYSSGGSAASSKEEVVTDVQVSLDRGFSSFKMRVGLQAWEIDQARVAAAHGALGGGELMVDAIMGTLRPPWTEDFARARAKDLEPFKLRWLEEPLFPDDFSGMARLREGTSIPIAAGEAFTSQSDFKMLVDCNAIDVMQFDATHAGGITASIAIEEKARRKGLDRAAHVWGSAAAISANATVSSAAGGVPIVEVPLAKLNLTDQMWIDPPVIKDGRMLLPEVPGLGISLTESTKDKFMMVPGSGYKL